LFFENVYLDRDLVHRAAAAQDAVAIAEKELMFVGRVQGRLDLLQ
jgi:hypothetical protein